MKKVLKIVIAILVLLLIVFCSKEISLTSQGETEWGKVHNEVVNKVVNKHKSEKQNLITIENFNQLEREILQELYQQYGIEEDMRIFSKNSSENCRKLLFGNQEALLAMDPKEFFIFIYNNIDKLADENAISVEVANTIKFAFEDILENEEILSQYKEKELIQRFVNNMTRNFQTNNDFRVRRAQEITMASAENIKNNYLSSGSKYRIPWEGLAICACDGLGGATASAACLLLAAIDGEIW